MGHVTVTKENIKRLKQEIYKNPNNFDALIRLGKCLFDNRKYRKSIKWFEKVLEIDKKNIEAINGLASAFLKCGLLYSARKYFEKSLSISPGNSPARRILSKLKENPVTQKKPVTFYVPCYNAERFIAACMEGALAQTYPISEILIIDDGSSDKTLDIANKYPVCIIRHEKNHGLGSARNTALKHAKGDFIASVDADVMPDKYWLEYLIVNFVSDEIGGVGGKLLEEKTLTVVDRWRQVNMAQHWGERRKVNPYTITGGNTVYRKKCLKEIGGYHEKFTTNHEDTDLSLRVRMLHYKLIYDPRAIAHHLRTDSLKSLLNTYWRYYKTPLGELLALFNNFKRLTIKIDDNFNRLRRKVLNSLKNHRFHLLYLDILSGFWEILEDINYIQEYSKLPRDIVTHTFLATLAGIRHLLEQKQGVSAELINFILEDLQALVDLLNSGYRPYLKKLGIIPCASARNFPKKYKQIKSVLPKADFKFVQKTLQGWRKMFKLEPLTWKKVEVSAQRVHYEEKYNPEKMPGLKVMLVNPPWRKKGRYGVRAGSRWPLTLSIDTKSFPPYLPFPFFLSYATAVLKKNGINAVIVDAIAEWLSDEEFLERVRGFSPDLVLIEAATASIENDLEWAQRIKDINEHIKIVFSGTHVTALGREFLEENPDIDYLIVGEYEYALLELSKSLKNGKPPQNISGLIYRDRDGKIISNGRAEGIVNLDDLPLPERLTLPIYNYNDDGAGTPSPTVQVMASRGCPFGCIFCLWPQVLYGNKKYRFHSPIRVVDEMEMLIKEYGFKGIYFDDDTFNIGKDRILKTCREIKRRKIKVPWSIMARADTSDYQTFKAMKGAGLRALKFGLESASQELLDNCGKELKLSAVEKAVDNCKKLGIKVHLAFMFGLPQETKKTIEDTIAYALKLDPNSAQFSLATPFPGTEYYKVLEKKEQLVTKDWSRYDGNMHVVFRQENLSAKEFIVSLRRAQEKWDMHLQQKRFNQGFLVTQEDQKEKITECKGKIAIVDLPFTWPPRGGASCDIAAVGKHLTKEGFSVQLFVPFYKDFFQRGNIEKPLLFPVQQIQFNKKTFVPEIVCRRFKEAIDNFEPDYIIIGDGWALKPYLVCALRGYKVFLRFYAYENLCLIHNGTFLRDGLRCPYNFLKHREKCLECINRVILKKGAMDWSLKELLLSRGLTKEFHGLLKKSLRQAYGIIVSNTIITRMLSPFNKNIYIIPGGVDTERFNAVSNRKPKKGCKNILMTGRVDDEAKGLHILKAACKGLWSKREDFTLTVTGREKSDGPFLKSTGWLDQDRLLRLYKEADICVFPSIWPEPFGLTVLEAMASGKPVIASHIGGLKKIVVNAKTGFLVKPGNVDELVKKINFLLDRPKLREEMGRRARKRAEELYNWPDIIKKYYLPLFSQNRR